MKPVPWYGSPNWLSRLRRRGWAWEFLRRSAEYRLAFENGSSSPGDWGLLRFENPDLDMRHAKVFWRMNDCLEVLPMSACNNAALGNQVTLDLANLGCETSVVRDDPADRSDVLFSQEGCFLQLAIFGGGDLKNIHLVISALGDLKVLGARTAALRRLNDLLHHKAMRPVLYPLESRASRLTVVLSALDGAIAGLSQREIAEKIFSESRVKREWNRGQDHMRDQVRRAVAAGQSLSAGGYRQFLKPTTTRLNARTALPRDELTDGFV